MPLMISNALEDKVLPIYGDGKQERTWLHVEDHCRGIAVVLERGKLGEIYNISGADVAENISIARTILRILREARIVNRARRGPAGTRPAVCDYFAKNRNGIRLEAGDFTGRGIAADDRLVSEEFEMAGGRARRRVPDVLPEKL